MIYLIHGKNEVDSRRFLTKLKTSYNNVKTWDNKSLTKKDLDSNMRIASKELFGGKSAFLVEGFNGESEILPKLTPEGLDLILWSNKKLFITGKDLKVFLFDRITKANTFKLADAILFKQEVQAYNLLDELLSSKEPPEKIIGTINRGLCLVFLVKENTISRTNLSSYIQQKHIDQSRYWSKASVKRALVRLLKTDLAIKDGTKPNIALSNLISQLMHA